MTLLNDGQGIRDYLINPTRTLSYAECLQEWNFTHVCVLAEVNRPLQKVSAFLNALRGAWGQQLYDMGSTDAQNKEPCKYNPACALDAIFNDHKLYSDHQKVGRPYFFEVNQYTQEKKNVLDIRVVLSGIAGEWAQDTLNALVRACVRPISDGGKDALNLNILDWDIGTGGIPTLLGKEFTLSFETPLKVSDNGERNINALGFVSRLDRRMRAIAPWHGCLIENEWSKIRLDIDQMQFMPIKTETISLFRQPASTQKRYAGTGLIGQWYIRAPSPVIRDLVALGAACHVGAQTTLGLGRYVVYSHEQPLSE
jgi:CRISPR-associated endoribonuclease Cas6